MSISFKNIVKNITSAPKKLFQGIFGKKSSDAVRNYAEQIGVSPKEIRKRAKELNISPEEYVKMKQDNGSIWNNSTTEGGSYYNSDMEQAVGTIENIKQNLHDKYGQLGIPIGSNIEAPSLDLVSSSKPVKDAQQEADSQNEDADNYLQWAYQEAQDNIFTAKQQLNTAEQTADTNNNAANNIFLNAQTTADNNNKQAAAAQQATFNQTNAANAAAQQNVETTQQQADADNAQAQSNTQDAQNRSTAAMEAVTTSQKDLDSANAQLDALQNTDADATAVDQAQQQRDNSKAQLEKAKSEEQKAKEELDAAKQNEESTKQKGQQSVNAANQELQKTEADGTKKNENAEAHTAEVKQQGVEDTTAAQKGVTDTAAQGKKDVAAQQNNVTQVSADGQQSVADAQSRVKSTKQEGENAVTAAQKGAMKEVRTAQSQAAQQLNAATSNETAKALQDAANARFQQEMMLGRNPKLNGAEDVLPDGKVNDRVPYQEKVNNCWAHSGVTSMASTADGKAMLDGGVYRDKAKGVTSVCLGEAKNRGKGYNQSGVYTFTDKEIAEGAHRFGSGDGDNTAYMLATEKYLQDIGENHGGKNASDYNTNSRFYEIVSGKKGTGVKNTNVIPVGITNGQQNNNSMYNYDVLRNNIQSGHTSGTLCFQTARGGLHAVSIVGVAQNGNLLIQDSINDGKTNQRFSTGKYSEPFTYVGTKNGAPTYEVSRKMYENAIACGVYRRA